MRGVDLLLRPTPLKAGLRLGHAVLHRLDADSRPRARATTPTRQHSRMTFVSTRTGPRWRAIGASQFDRGFDPVRREEVRKIIDRQIEQARRSPRRNAALVDGAARSLP